MNVTHMLAAYRGAANLQMQEVAHEFRQLSPADQREFLFWMIVDTATNPTKVQVNAAGSAERPQ